MLNDEALSWRHEIRHDQVEVATLEGDQELVMVMTEGVPQGDPNGPVLYVIGYTGVTEDIDCERESKGYGGLLFEHGTGLPGRMIDICRTTFVDDHKETHMIDTVGKTVEEVRQQICERVLEIVTNQKRWQVINNLKKTVLLVELHGKGSRKLRKALGSKITIQDGFELNITQQHIFGSTGWRRG